jgi:hypothetical protein
MQTTLDKLTDFLNIPLETLSNQSSDMIAKMVEAVKEDDFMTIHHLAYNIKLEEG